MGEHKTISSRIPKPIFDKMEDLIEKKDFRGRSEFIRKSIEDYIKKLEPPQTKLERTNKKINKLQKELEDLKEKKERLLAQQKREREGINKVKDGIKEALREKCELEELDSISVFQSPDIVDGFLVEKRGFNFKDEKGVRKLMVDYSKEGDFTSKIDEYVERLDEEGLIEY